MRTCFSVRGLSTLPLILAVFSAFACNGSPIQPDSAIDLPAGSTSRPFDAPSTISQPSRLSEGEMPDTEFIGEEDTSELIDAEEVEGLDSSDFDPNSLTASTPTAATAGTVAVTGVIKDKGTGRVIPGVSVKITGLTPVTSNSRGVYRINVRPGTRTLKFSKKGYTTKSVTRLVNRAMRIDVLLTPSAAALSSINLADHDVSAGTVVNGTIKLNRAAPSGGAKVFLSSNSTATATVLSASVTIPAGKTTGSFKVNAKAAGSTVIKAKYNSASKTTPLTVRGKTAPPPPPPPSTDILPVARFEYRPSQCEVIENPSGNSALIATCTFDATDSTAPTGSTFTWTFPGPNTITKSTRTLTNMPLTCGSLPNGIFERRVSLTIRTPSGAADTSHADVTFTKSGLC